jgi:hypothetical protein
MGPLPAIEIGQREPSSSFKRSLNPARVVSFLRGVSGAPVAASPWGLQGSHYAPYAPCGPPEAGRARSTRGPKGLSRLL